MAPRAPFHPAEMDPHTDYPQWKQRVRYDSSACDGELVLLLGPAGAGKSQFWTQALAGHVPQAPGSSVAAAAIDWSAFVSLDGDEMREIHAGFCARRRELGQQGSAAASTCGGHACNGTSSLQTSSQEAHGEWLHDCKQLHEAMKPVTARFKKLIISRGIVERAPRGRNFAVPLTFSTPDAYEWLAQFREAGYCVRVVVVLVAPFDVVTARVTQRAQRDAALQTMTRQKYDMAFSGIKEALNGALWGSQDSSALCVPSERGVRILVIDSSKDGVHRLLLDVDAHPDADASTRTAWLTTLQCILNDFEHQ
ncbi:hypothetical protein AB1Y20_008478 [Prymnesium parvum]|uniref:Uncharacterized protein n=1 Tax=Prymnesium parvum TaxID=97485 RepID=A0AB34IT92_PRYPA